MCISENLHTLSMFVFSCNILHRTLSVTNMHTLKREQHTVSKREQHTVSKREQHTVSKREQHTVSKREQHTEHLTVSKSEHFTVRAQIENKHTLGVAPL
jgi:hypothetical protein